jgi:glutamate synthase domain-containing protein 1
MCGIVGLFLKDAKLELELGTLTAGMLKTLCDRGPDSAGFAVYGSGISGMIKLTLRLSKDFDLNLLLARLSTAAGTPLSPVLHDSHAVVSVPATVEAAMRAEIARHSGVFVVSAGRRMEVFKEVGRPDKVAARFVCRRCPAHTRSAIPAWRPSRP